MTDAILRTTWNRLDPALRAELEAVVPAGTDTFHSQYHDAVAWWLLLMLVCAGGAGAALWDLQGDALGWWRTVLVSHPLEILQRIAHAPQHAGLVAAVVIGTWTAVTWIGNHNRRGLALTSRALVVVRGRHLRVLRYADVTSVTRSSHGGRGRRFTALTLKTSAGQTLGLITTGTWADAALGRLAVAR